MFVCVQSKLNCEVLHDELAFEVRWAVAGDSIVLQLVAKLVHVKLNCEVLHDELAFEVRWAVAGDSIVLQLVAKLGECLSASV
ncbi:hypothetical protein PYW07_010312 [Mythimna separata]|uniref:Uncharacterized protein n=1 Tax=Mythimna separata TaxID=271217 RepID=A0AAD7YHA3_MYTSE|nr:hypothetical protein PYW07_010312 [Mythimna separata]